MKELTAALADAAECRSLRDLANQSLERRTAELLAAEVRAETAEREIDAVRGEWAGEVARLQSELAASRAASRAATDKTRQEADALFGKLSAVKRWALNLQAEGNKWGIPAWQTMSTEVLALCGKESSPLPLPPKET